MRYFIVVEGERVVVWVDKEAADWSNLRDPKRKGRVTYFAAPIEKFIPTTSPPMDRLTNTERLLLAQAVYQEGANDWSKVSQIVSNHPLIGRPKSYFNPSVCIVP